MKCCSHDNHKNFWLETALQSYTLSPTFAPAAIVLSGIKHQLITSETWQIPDCTLNLISHITEKTGNYATKHKVSAEKRKYICKPFYIFKVLCESNLSCVTGYKANISKAFMSVYKLNLTMMRTICLQRFRLSLHPFLFFFCFCSKVVKLETFRTTFGGVSKQLKVCEFPQSRMGVVN